MNRMILFAFLLCSLTACSSEQEAATENSSIDKTTDHVADAVVERINRPMDKARAVKDLEEQRVHEIKEQADN